MSSMVFAQNTNATIKQIKLEKYVIYDDQIHQDISKHIEFGTPILFSHMEKNNTKNPEPHPAWWDLARMSGQVGPGLHGHNLEQGIHGLPRWQRILQGIPENPLNDSRWNIRGVSGFEIFKTWILLPEPKQKQKWLGIYWHIYLESTNYPNNFCGCGKHGYQLTNIRAAIQAPIWRYDSSANQIWCICRCVLCIWIIYMIYMIYMIYIYI